MNLVKHTVRRLIVTATTPSMPAPDQLKPSPTTENHNEARIFSRCKTVA